MVGCSPSPFPIQSPERILSMSGNPTNLNLLHNFGGNFSPTLMDPLRFNSWRHNAKIGAILEREMKAFKMKITLDPHAETWETTNPA